ncbi:MAG: glycosyltransferase family 39 protein [Caldilinea sp.]
MNKYLIALRQPSSLWIPLLWFTAVQLLFIRNVDPVEYDEAIYMNVARSIRETGVAWRPIAGGALYAEHTPLYQYLLGYLTMIVGENIFIGRFVTLLVAAFTIVLLYHFVWRITRSRLAAFCAAWLLAVAHFFALYSFFLREEIVMSFFVLASVYFLWMAQETGRERYIWFSSIVATMAVLTKELALIFWGVLGLYALITADAWQQRLKQGLVYSLPMAVGLGMWVTWIGYHSPSRFQATVQRWLDSVAGTSAEAQASANLEVSRWGLDALSWLQIVFNDLWGYGLLASLLLAGLFALLRKKWPPQIVWLAIGYLATAVALSLFINLKEPRHLIATVPMAVLATVLLIDWRWVEARLQANPRLRLLSLLLLILVTSHMWIWQLPTQGQFFLHAAWYRPKIAHRLFREAPYYSILRDAGQFVAQYVPPNRQITVVHEGPVVAYYAARPYIFLYTLPFGGVQQALDETTYLVFDQPLFFHLTAEEVQQVMIRIHQEFELLSTVVDQHRTVDIFQRHSSFP